MFVLSDRELSALDLKKIKDILKESNCPNESFTNTFDDYQGYENENTIKFGTGTTNFTYKL